MKTINKEGISAEIHYVPCPHCIVGGVDIVVEKSSDNSQAKVNTSPKKCDTCSAYFGIKPRLRLESYKL